MAGICIQTKVANINSLPSQPLSVSLFCFFAPLCSKSVCLSSSPILLEFLFRMWIQERTSVVRSLCTVSCTLHNTTPFPHSTWSPWKGGWRIGREHRDVKGRESGWGGERGRQRETWIMKVARDLKKYTHRAKMVLPFVLVHHFTFRRHAETQTRSHVTLFLLTHNRSSHFHTYNVTPWLSRCLCESMQQTKQFSCNCLLANVVTQPLSGCWCSMSPNLSYLSQCLIYLT